MRVYNGRATHKRGKYKNTIENRGRIGKEMLVVRSFWKSNLMDDIYTMTSEELDQAIDAFLLKYQETQQKRNKNWWYPETVNYRMGK